MKVVLLEVSLMNCILQMEGESGVIRRIIDELHSSDIQGNQMEGESGFTRSIIDVLHFLNIQR